MMTSHIKWYLLNINQLIISLACQEFMSKPKGTPQSPPPSGFLPHMQSTVLHDKFLIGSDNQEMTSGEVDQSHADITEIEQKISEPEIT